ncbi:MAG: hypothetical protein OXJ52_05345 [Oligoflexia bacterium]|nr:hypothetical protein [Oligoflexia bacterium]
MKKIIILFSLIFSSYSFGYYNPYAKPKILPNVKGYIACTPTAIHNELIKLQSALAGSHKNLYRMLKSNNPINTLDQKIENIWKAIATLNTELMRLTCKKDPTKKTEKQCAKSKGSWLDNVCYFPKTTK